MKSSITANGAAALYERNDLVAKAFGRCGIGLDGRSSPDWPRCSDDPHPIGRSLVGAGQAEAQSLCPAAMRWRQTQEVGTIDRAPHGEWGT